MLIIIFKIVSIPKGAFEKLLYHLLHLLYSMVYTRVSQQRCFDEENRYG